MKGEDLAEGPVLHLLARALLLTVGAGVVAVAEGPVRAVVLAAALLVVSGLGAVPLPSPSASLVQAFAETTVLALIIGGAGDAGMLFLPLLLLAVLSAGQRGGLLPGAVAAFVGSLAWYLAILSTTPPSGLPDRVADPLVWTVLLVVTGLIGGWLRRLTIRTRSYSDSAYAEAFRLLSELQEVARNLSLGLDPATLATALLDAVGEQAPDSRRTVSVRTSEGRLAPLVGAAPEGPSAGPDQVVPEVAPAAAVPARDDPRHSAWTSGEHVVRTAPGGQQHHAFPVRVGDRVVAVLDVVASMPPATVDHLEQVVAETGPKLAAALLFDEVRQLATVDERLRLAREIHDGVAQELASVGYMLDDLAARVPDEAAVELQGMRDHVRGVVGELRLSIFDLRVGVDDSIGLGTALSEHVQRVGQQSDLVVHTVLDEHGERLPAGVEVELLRIAQEAVTNVRRHARASNLWVECTVDAPKAWIRIADDGIGLQPARPQSMGLRGMRERTRRIGGDLVVGERPGGGTVVEVSIGDWDEEGPA